MESPRLEDAALVAATALGLGAILVELAGIVAQGHVDGGRVVVLGLAAGGEEFEDAVSLKNQLFINKLIIQSKLPSCRTLEHTKHLRLLVCTARRQVHTN